MTPSQLFSHISQVVPSFEPVLAAHVQDNGELLPHPLMSELLRFVGAQFKQPGHTPVEVLTILAILEAEVSSGDAETENVIAVSFLEDMEAAPFFPDLYALLGPKLLQAHAPFAWHPSHSQNAV